MTFAIALYCRTCSLKKSHQFVTLNAFSVCAFALLVEGALFAHGSILIAESVPV